MGKLRHIALSVDDVAKAQKFFEEAFDMKPVGESGTGTAYLSDGTINIALLNRKGKPLGYEGKEPFFGIDHFGIWVDDAPEACKKVEAAGPPMSWATRPAIQTASTKSNTVPLWVAFSTSPPAVGAARSRTWCRPRQRLKNLWDRRRAHASLDRVPLNRANRVSSNNLNQGG